MPPRPSSSHSQGMPGMPQQSQQALPSQNLNIPNNSVGAPPPSQMSQMDGSPMGQQQGGPMPPMQQQGAQPYPGQNIQNPGQQPPHGMHGSYKMSSYPQQSQYSQGNYPPRAQYTGYAGQHGPPPPNSQYPRPMQNHVNPQYPPHAPYHQVWPPPPQNSGNSSSPGAMTNHIGGGKNIGPPSAQSPQQQAPGQPVQPQTQLPGQQQQKPGGPQQQQQQPGGSPRQLNYLKQHLQHKGGYQQGSTPPPQGFGNGPGGIHPMGPPSHHMGPPTSAMGPPGTPPSHIDQMHHPEGMVPQDNGMSSQASHQQATSIITTGPDGTQLDDASQQSTLSNTSIGKT